MEMVIHRKGNRWQCPVFTCVRLNALQKKGKVLEIPDVRVIDNIRKIIKDKRIVQRVKVNTKRNEGDRCDSNILEFNAFIHLPDLLNKRFFNGSTGTGMRFQPMFFGKYISLVLGNQPFDPPA